MKCSDSRRAVPLCRGASRFLLGALVLTAAGFPRAAHAAHAISFLPPVSYPKFSAGPLTAADFDGDGNPDIAVASYDGGDLGSVSLFYGRGDGTFSPPVEYPIGNDLMRVIGADVNGDGLLDMLVAQRGGNRIAVFMNQGRRSFAPAVFYAVETGPIDLHAADFNGDGRPDLAVSAHYSYRLAVLLNRGDGTFLPPVYYPGGTYTARIVSGDWNGDGKVDLAMANYESSNVLIYFGDGTGRFTVGGDYVVGYYASGIATNDFNGDGRPDLAISNTFSDTVSILFGDGQGGFSGPTNYPGNTYPAFLESADLDGDGDPDLAVPNNHTNYFSMFENDGKGNFFPAVRFPSNGNDTRTLTIGDFNRDGRPDVAVGQRETSTIAVYINNTPRPTPVVHSLICDPSTVIGGAQTSTGWVALELPAPPGGAIVTLNNNLPAATVPDKVLVPGGAARASFTIRTSPVTATHTGTVTASCSGTSQSAGLTVRPIGVASVEMTPNPVRGGKMITGQVTLECPAGPGDIVVALSSSQPTVAFPQVSTLRIPAGSKAATIKLKTRKVGATTAVTISATANGITQSKVLSINP